MEQHLRLSKDEGDLIDDPSQCRRQPHVLAAQRVLQYIKDSIYCLPCYLFRKKPTSGPGSDAFTEKGFNNWKKHSKLVLLEAMMKALIQKMENSKYTSPTIQKEILHILANKVQNAIREEIGDAKFCILVDEARDESERGQMAIILRFVDKEGFIKERFFHVVYVKDTTALTLKNEICDVLSHYNLHIENIRGQGYDGLQLVLVTASREVKDVHQFFDHLVNIINIVVGSSKRNDELQHAQAEQVENMIASNETKTGRGANQIGALQRVGDTRLICLVLTLPVSTATTEQVSQL
ncbi:uncharacterized protein LOC142631367 [Castanea sativa]|uniref:uncharacterized protein LOC142631367 n=1 Tax=Castanea sativa TaxID=21020 RepID=UPI003F650D5A